MVDYKRIIDYDYLKDLRLYVECPLCELPTDNLNKHITDHLNQDTEGIRTPTLIRAFRTIKSRCPECHSKIQDLRKHMVKQHKLYDSRIVNPNLSLKNYEQYKEELDKLKPNISPPRRFQSIREHWKKKEADFISLAKTAFYIYPKPIDMELYKIACSLEMLAEQ